MILLLNQNQRSYIQQQTMESVQKGVVKQNRTQYSAAKYSYIPKSLQVLDHSFGKENISKRSTIQTKLKDKKEQNGDKHQGRKVLRGVSNVNLRDDVARTDKVNRLQVPNEVSSFGKKPQNTYKYKAINQISQDSSDGYSCDEPVQRHTTGSIRRKNKDSHQNEMSYGDHTFSKSRKTKDYSYLRLLDPSLDIGTFQTEKDQDLYMPISHRFEHKDQQFTKQKTNNDYSSHFQILFDRLDCDQSGRLCKDNCEVTNIPEDFKYILGSIFTRIKFKQLVCNKKQFVVLCQNAVKDIGFTQLKQYFNEISSLKTTYRKVSVAKGQQYDYKNKYQRIIEAETGPVQLNRKPSSRRSYKQDVQSALDIEKSGVSGRSSSRNSVVKKIVSDSIIRQHKQGLESLNDLNNRMQRYLNQRSNLNFDEVVSEGQNTLKFDELVKHI